MSVSASMDNPQLHPSHQLHNRRSNGSSDAAAAAADHVNGSAKIENSSPDPISNHSEEIPSHLAPLSIHLVLVGAALGFLIGGSLVFALPAFNPSNFAGLMLEKTGETGRLVSALLPPQLALYFAFWASFHLLEFLVTARWNSSRLMKDSFLLLNGLNYHAAHLLGIVEFLLESYLFPTHKTPLTLINIIGLLIVILGQYLRSMAMIHAASNFSHMIASNKRPDHVLVKTGLYGRVRHPSYTGFFTWALGTQILLANPVSAIVFCVVLWRFFSSRIENEEKHLISFFGEEYKEYKRQVPSGILFVK